MSMECYLYKYALTASEFYLVGSKCTGNIQRKEQRIAVGK